MQTTPDPPRRPQIINIDELSGYTTTGGSIASTMKQLGAAAGAARGAAVRA